MNHHKPNTQNPPTTPHTPAWHLLTILTILTLLLTTTHLHPQDNTTPLTLPQLKQKLHQALLTTLLPEKQHQRQTLYSLEKQLASGGDYNSAIRARDQRLIIENEIAKAQQQLLDPHLTNPNTTLTNPIQLNPTQATLTQLTLHPTNNTLTNWAPNTSSATYTLPNLPPGGYEILLTYTLNATSNATLQLKETRYTLTTSLTPTDKPIEKNCGTLRITNGNGTLSIQALQLPLDQSLQLHTITLLPNHH